MFWQCVEAVVAVNRGFFTDQCLFVFVIADRLRIYEKGSSVVENQLLRPFSKRKKRNVNGRKLCNHILIYARGYQEWCLLAFGTGTLNIR